MDAPRDITDAPAVSHRQIAGGLLLLAGPLIASNISRTVMSFIDFVMVSALGRDAQAAVTPASLVLWTLAAFGMGLASVVNTFVSQSLGRRRHAACGSFGWQGLHLSVLIAVAVLPLWFAVEPFFAWAGHGPALQAMEVAYTKIGLFSVGPTVAAVTLGSFFAGVHKPSVTFLAMLTSNLFNVVGNYALIFGNLGCPALGVEGAAWATLAASILQVLLLLGWMLSPGYARRFHTWRTWRPSPARMKRVLSVGWPAGFQFMTDIGAWTIFTTFLVGRFGPAHLAANNIIFKYLEISFMPASGMGHALTAAVGRSIGGGRVDLARRYVHWCAVFCMGYMSVFGVVMALGRHRLPGLLTEDADVIRIAATLMVFVVIFQISDAMCITFNGALKGAGDTRWPAIIWITCQLAILLGGGWLMMRFVPQWGSPGLWIAATVQIIVCGCGLGLRYRWGPWARIEL